MGPLLYVTEKKKYFSASMSNTIYNTTTHYPHYCQTKMISQLQQPAGIAFFLKAFPQTSPIRFCNKYFYLSLIMQQSHHGSSLSDYLSENWLLRVWVTRSFFS